MISVAPPEPGGDPADEFAVATPAPSGPQAGTDEEAGGTADLAADQAPFAWADGDEGLLPLCVAAARDVPLRQALAVLAPAPRTGPGPVDAARAWVEDGNEADLRTLVTARRQGRWTVVQEDGDARCTQDATARRLSRDTTYVAASWGVSGEMALVVARNGRVLRSFDPLFRSEALEQDGEPLPAEAGLDWDHQQSAMLAVLARLTDVRIGGSRWVPDGAELAAGT